MINIYSLVCPNCLTEFPVTQALVLALAEMELLHNLYRPAVCPMCGHGMLVDDEYKAHAPKNPIEMKTETYLTLIAMQRYAEESNLSKWKQPWNN